MYLRSSPFVFECATVWSGTDKVEAEKVQSRCDPAFEVECELVQSAPSDGCNERAWRARHKASPRRMARSFLYKIADAMLSTGITFEMVCDAGSSSSTVCTFHRACT